MTGTAVLAGGDNTDALSAVVSNALGIYPGSGRISLGYVVPEFSEIALNAVVAERVTAINSVVTQARNQGLQSDAANVRPMTFAAYRRIQKTEEPLSREEEIFLNKLYHPDEDEPTLKGYARYLKEIGRAHV